MLIFVVVTFIVISRMSNVITKNVEDIRLELDKTSYPIYHPLGISTAFLKAFFSFVSLFLPGS